jgi:hypothetical protein
MSELGGWEGKEKSCNTSWIEYAQREISVILIKLVPYSILKKEL